MYVDTGISCTAVNLAAEQTAYVGVLMMQKKRQQRKYPGLSADLIFDVAGRGTRMNERLREPVNELAGFLQIRHQQTRPTAAGWEF